MYYWVYYTFIRLPISIIFNYFKLYRVYLLFKTLTYDSSDKNHVFKLKYKYTIGMNV